MIEFLREEELYHFPERLIPSFGGAQSDAVDPPTPVNQSRFPAEFSRRTKAIRSSPLFRDKPSFAVLFEAPNQFPVADLSVRSYNKKNNDLPPPQPRHIVAGY